MKLLIYSALENACTYQKMINSTPSGGHVHAEANACRACLPGRPPAAHALLVCLRSSAQHSSTKQLLTSANVPIRMDGVRGCRCTTRVHVMDAIATAAGWCGGRGAERPWHLVLDQAVAADVHLRQQRVDVLAAQLQAGCHVA